MELHPDRNYGNVEETTKQFAEVQSAYEVLSDAQERSWYDTHRDTILRSEDDVSGEHYEHNVRITTAQDVTRIITRFHGPVDFSDSPTGFYSMLRDTFDDLAREEQLTCEWEDLDLVEYPSFGHANDHYEDTVKHFYAVWNGFVTKKTFSWEDIYRYSDAPDRRVRRMMEKENKRLREEAIRAFNDAVRSLVAFVKKRDPRFKPNMQTEAERQNVLRKAAVAQAARSRAANKARHDPRPEEVPEWMKSSEVQEDSLSDEAEDKVKETFECVVCNKHFKSEKQYEAHENSRKHMRAVQHIRRQMQQEDKTLDSDDSSEQNDTETASSSSKEPIDPRTNPASEAGSGKVSTTPNRGDEQTTSLLLTPTESMEDSAGQHVENLDGDTLSLPCLETSASSSDDEYPTRKKVEDRILGGKDEVNAVDLGFQNFQADINDISAKLVSESSQRNSDQIPQPKVGKAKEKRAKKAAHRDSATAAPDTDFKCASCQAGFPSKSRLFNHINVSGHAAPITKPTKGSKGKKR